MLSLLAHGGAIALTRGRGHAVTTPPRTRAVAPQPIAPQPPVDEPMVVEVIDVVELPAEPVHAASHPATGQAAATTRRATAGPPSSGESSGAASSVASGTGGSSLMRMRGGGGDGSTIGRGLSPEFIERFLAQSRPVPPADTEAQRIDDDLAADREALNNPRWVANASPEALLAMRTKLVEDLDRRDHQELHPAGGGWWKSVHTVHDMTGRERESFRADVAPDGRVTLHDDGDGRYEPQERAWLDETRDDRIAIRKHHERDVLAHTPQIVQHNLEWAWQRGRDLATRKRDLFELWDECAESGDSSEAGATARGYVIAFIRWKLPAGSPDAYTASELAALNAHRQSKQAFAPYDE